MRFEMVEPEWAKQYLQLKTEAIIEWWTLEDQLQTLQQDRVIVYEPFEQRDE